MKKYRFYKRQSILAFLLFCVTSIFVGSTYAEGLLPGSQYRVIQPIYLMAIYQSLNDRIVSKETAQAHLHPIKYYNKSDVAFQDEVLVGTIITIMGPATKPWYLPWSANTYSVRLDPDVSRGLNVYLKLNRGMEGDLDGLNPKLFSPLKSQ